MKIIRWIAIIPFITLCMVAIYDGLCGMTFIYTKVIGMRAVLLTIILYLYFFWWLWLLCIAVIIITSVIIKRKEGENTKNHL